MRDGLDTSHVRFVEAAGVPTRIYEAGEGEPLVLIHGGWYGSLYSLDCWSLNLHELAHDFHVVAWDKLGQGHTGNPASEDGYTYEALLQHSIALFDLLDLGPAHLVGHSMGALLATRIALDRPDLTRTLVVIDTNTLAPNDARYPRSQFYLDLAKRTPPGPPTRETVRMEPDAQSLSNAHVTDDYVDRMLAIAQLPKQAEAAALAPTLRDAVWGVSLEATKARTLAVIEERGTGAPTLVVWGANDVSAPLPLASLLYERIAPKTEHAELHVIAHAGHYVYREQPDAFLRLVRGFCLGR